MPARITLAGDIGSGKTLVSRILQTLSGFSAVSTGAIHRQIAARRDMTPLELNQYSQIHREIDDQLDSYLKDLNHSPDNLIVDSRMAWHFVKAAFKVYLKVDPDVAARRVMSAEREEEKSVSLDQVLASNLQRKALENERFRRLYGVDCEDRSHYDLVIDTSHASPEVIAERIFSGFKDWRQRKCTAIQT